MASGNHGLFDDEDIFASAHQEPPPLNTQDLRSGSPEDALFGEPQEDINLKDDDEPPSLLQLRDTPPISHAASTTPPLSAHNVSDSASDLRSPDDGKSPLERDADVATAPVLNLHSGSTVPPHFEPRIEPPTLATNASGDSVTKKPVPTKRRDDYEDDIMEDPTSKNLEITIPEYNKIDQGLHSYVTYRVNTRVKGAIGGFKDGEEFHVDRRFSDFLGLHNKLASKHLHNGRIVPPPPEKSVIGMTRTKMSKQVEEDTSSVEFLSRRRAALERFLQRVAMHPVLVMDPDFREFLTTDKELPKATNTAALSGAGVMRLIGKVGDTFTKMAYRMDENDTWFDEKQLEIENLDEQFKKLHVSIESLVHYRKELATSTASYCKSMSMLAACEENTALSRALSQLAETQEQVGLVHEGQADKDFYILSEVLKDYIALIATVKAVFHERVKAWQSWQTAQQTLAKKRETKTRLELAGRSDKLPQAKKEVEEGEVKVQECQDQFDALSKMIRKEMKRFDAQRVKDFKQAIVQYLESLALSQKQVIKYWEAFLPEAKAISTS